MLLKTNLLQKINKLWRVCATGLGFLLFACGGAFLSFVLFPLINCTSQNKKKKQALVQKIIQQSFKFFCFSMKFSRGMDYKITGAERLLEDKNCLILSNHPSLIDYVLIASIRPQCDCLVKASIWNNPFINRVVKAAGYIPNIDSENILSQCSARLNENNVLLLFPEGTRSRPGKPSVLKRGAAQIAVRTRADIRIVHITVSPSFLTKGRAWYQVPDTKPFFHVEIKGKINVDEFIGSNVIESIAARRLNKRLQSELLP